MAPVDPIRGGGIEVEVVYSPGPGEVHGVPLQMAAGSTAQQAVVASGLLERFPALQQGELSLGVWGKRCEGGQVLRDRDRVELYRPLKVDPKEARRVRYRAHREAKAG